MRNARHIVSLISPGDGQVLLFQCRRAQEGVLHCQRSHGYKIAEQLVPVMITRGFSKQMDEGPAIVIVAVLAGMEWLLVCSLFQGNVQGKLRHFWCPFFPAVCGVLPPYRGGTQWAFRKKSSSGHKAASQMTERREEMRTGAVAGGLNFSGTVQLLSDKGWQQTADEIQEYF
ncbi:hypothetical protein FNH47_12630 [Salmonella enterica subsp. houtenae]|uniref:Uncharacterized protein n=1 Tax=Salmonella houtenae TaxID=59205 RepID=A0A5Y2SFZ6_SALHO|nr:hypothetical protein [Salmonella enterica subsp. houtenae]QKT20665.1 hypothetical protein HPG84_23480 [Salmonella enterica]